MDNACSYGRSTYSSVRHAEVAPQDTWCGSQDQIVAAEENPSRSLNVRTTRAVLRTTPQTIHEAMMWVLAGEP
jgi:hypothetical protein